MARAQVLGFSEEKSKKLKAANESVAEVSDEWAASVNGLDPETGKKAAAALVAKMAMDKGLVIPAAELNREAGTALMSTRCPEGALVSPVRPLSVISRPFPSLSSPFRPFPPISVLSAPFRSFPSLYAPFHSCPSLSVPFRPFPPLSVPLCL